MTLTSIYLCPHSNCQRTMDRWWICNGMWRHLWVPRRKPDYRVIATLCETNAPNAVHASYPMRMSCRQSFRLTKCFWYAGTYTHYATISRIILLFFKFAFRNLFDDNFALESSQTKVNLEKLQHTLNFDRPSIGSITSSSPLFSLCRCCRFSYDCCIIYGYCWCIFYFKKTIWVNFK